DPAPVVYLVELGASSVNYMIRVWAARDDYWAVKERVTRNTKYALDAAGIGIPFPQRDVHIPKGIEVTVKNA
ncbi:MAG: small conductance mechanosensitive channel, partial [Phycisphaerales bacterium]